MTIDKNHALAQIAMFIAVLCNVLMGVSRRLGDLILGLLTILLSSSLAESPQKQDYTEFILNQLPVTLDTALKKFNLTSKTVTYAVCPKCHKTYAPKFLPGSSMPIYPDKCDNYPDPDTLCIANLHEYDKNGKQGSICKSFVYNSFHDYLASLLAREDLEDLMDHACDDLMASIKRNDPLPDVLTGVFDAKFVRSFEGPESGKLFVDRPGNEGRYLFAFNFDYFHAEGQSIRGASTSIGLLSGVCLNLPLKIRYQAENMYVAGIVPGPREPSKAFLNNYIRPIVDDFELSWKRGVKYSKTAKHKQGRLTRCAMAFSVNDLPAARQFAQCAHHSANIFCSRCSCTGRANLGRTDFLSEDWKPKTDIRQKADEWHNATTRKEQEDCFAQSGQRWSEVWRLPYWDTTTMLVVDPMHCLLLGLAQFQFREVLGLSEKAAATPSIVIAPFQYEFIQPSLEYITDYFHSTNDLTQVTQIHRLLLAPIGEEGKEDKLEDLDALKKHLLYKNLPPLRFVMDSLSIKPDVDRPHHPTIKKKSKVNNESDKPKQEKRKKLPVQYTKAECADMLIKWVRFYQLKFVYFYSNNLAFEVSTESPICFIYI